jgi:hypothetical protein
MTTTLDDRLELRLDLVQFGLRVAAFGPEGAEVVVEGRLHLVPLGDERGAEDELRGLAERAHVQALRGPGGLEEGVGLLHFEVGRDVLGLVDDDGLRLGVGEEVDRLERLLGVLAVTGDGEAGAERGHGLLLAAPQRRDAPVDVGLDEPADAPEAGGVHRHGARGEGGVAAHVRAHVRVLGGGGHVVVLVGEVVGPLQGLDDLGRVHGGLAAVVDDLPAVLVGETPPLGPPAGAGEAPLLAGDGRRRHGGFGVFLGPLGGGVLDARGVEHVLVVVEDHRARAVGDRVGLVLIGVQVGDGAEAGLHVETGGFDVLVEGDELALGRVRVDVLGHLHDVGAVAARDHGLDLLGVLVRRDELEFDLDVGVLGLEQVDAGLVGLLVEVAAPDDHLQGPVLAGVASAAGRQCRRAEQCRRGQADAFAPIHLFQHVFRLLAVGGTVAGRVAGADLRRG